MEQPDVIYVEFIGEAGEMLKLTTDKISGPNHMKAEELLGALARGVGGAVTRQSKGTPHVHIHEQEHTHTHEH
jgi:hypothetical protein